MVIIIYLFRDVPEATALLKVIFYLSKEHIYGVLKIMPKVVQMMVPSIPDIEVASSFFNAILLMLNKNKLLVSVETQREFIHHFSVWLYRWREMINKDFNLLLDPEKQADFIFLILGLSKSHLELVKQFAIHIGWFDERVEALFEILWKYKDVIFRNGIWNIPKLAKQITSDSIKSAVSFAATEAKEAMRKALKEGANDLIAIAKKNASNLDKTIKEQIEKVNRLMPENLNISGMLIFIYFTQQFLIT